MRVRRLLAATAALMLGGGLVVAVPTTASAATFTVNSNGDQPDQSSADGVCKTAVNTCTLRAAVQQANASAITADSIAVPAMTITLGTKLTVGANVTIDGAGARDTVITAVAGQRLLDVSGADVVVSDLALTGASGSGAGIALYHASGDLLLRSVRIADNRAINASDAAVYSVGDIIIERSEISSNVISNGDNGLGSQIRGGGVSALGPTLQIVSSTISGNVARHTASGTGAFGGGVFAGGSTQVLIEWSTITANRVQNTYSSAANGGNLYLAGASTLIRQSVIADGESISSTSKNCAAGIAKPVFADRNLVSDESCGAESPVITVEPPLLRDLGPNGGPTNSRPPKPGSPAIDAVPCAAATDQRGQARPIGGACDLGAVELGADASVAAAVSNPAPSPGADVVVTVAVSNAGLDTATATSASVTPSAGEVLSATTTQGTCTTGPTAVACNLGDLPGDVTATITIALRAPGSGIVSIPASVSAQQPDPDQADNATSTTFTVAPPATPATGSTPDTGGTTTTATTTTTTTTTTTGQTTGTPVVTASARCTNVITGTGKPNRLAGTAGGDRIAGKAGNDRIKGLGGDDCLSGDGGADVLVGGPGKDTIAGGAGADTIKIKDGTRDRVSCGGGRDTVVADATDRIAKDCEVVRR